MSDLGPALTRIERSIALKIALIYLAVGGTWVFVSGRVATWFSVSKENLELIEVLKGWTYILATAALLYLLVRRFTLAINSHLAALNDSEATHRNLAEARRQLLSELDHRVKNNLASLYSLITIYLAAARDKEELAEVLRSKIMAMKLVHEMIAAAGWMSVDLASLLNNIAALYEPQTRGHAVSFQGPPTRLAPSQAGALGMIAQELLANSLRHGALRSPTGEISAGWRETTPAGSETPKLLEMIWNETHFAAEAGIEPSAGRGVGLDLIRGLTEFDLCGQCDVRKAADSFTCTFRIPLANPESR